jgi:hypothetical protein
MPALSQDLIDAAVSSFEETGVSAAVTLAQYILESNWGRSMPNGSNNPFGIKARTGDPFVSALTHEEIGGRSVAVNARFRKFDSIEQAFVAHGVLIENGSPYQGLHAILGNADELANGLTGIYATDSHYGASLISLMDRYDLRQYDQQGPTSETYQLFLDGTFLLDMPVINDTAYCPVRDWANAMGFKLDWDPSNNTVSFDGETIETPAQIIGDHAYLPIRVLVTAAGLPPPTVQAGRVNVTTSASGGG